MHGHGHAVANKTESHIPGYKIYSNPDLVPNPKIPTQLQDNDIFLNK
jgi:hypothetical protein